MTSPGAAASGPELADADARERAVTEFARNLCVSAGAGSGKTSLLIERVLHALLARGMALERIVAITFTEKAAAEMRDRLRRALAAARAALADDADLTTAAERAPRAGEAQRALARLASAADPALGARKVRDRAVAALDAPIAFSTIHSFALGLLHRHPVEAGVPPEVEISVGDGFRRHARDAFPLLLDEALADPRRAPPLRAILDRIEVDDLQEAALELAWVPAAELTEPADPLLPLRATLRALEATLRPARAQASLGPRASKLEEQWDAVLLALERLRERGLGPRGRLELPAAVVDRLERSISKSRSIEGLEDVEGTIASLAEAHALLGRLLGVDESFVRQVVAVARPLGVALREGFALGGSVSADGALALAAELLARHPGVRRAEARAIGQLLVDEFQDTDPRQCEIVLLLSEEERGDPAARADDVRLAPGRLFLVGDPKQSIYRFRGADLDVYTRTTEQVERQGGARLELVTSFRSPPHLVEPVNALFAAWSDRDNDAEAPFAPLVSSRRRAGDPPAFEIWSVERGDGRRDAGSRREAEGRAIAEGIADLVNRGVAPGRIALLLRSLSELRHYVQPLRDLRLPFTLSGGRTFVQRSEVGELASLLLAGDEPDDEVAVLGALRSTLLAVPDAALLAARRECGTLRVAALHAATDATVRAAAATLAAFHDELARRPVVEAVERLVEGSPLLAIAASARDGDQRIANLRRLASAAAQAAERDGLTLAEAVRERVSAREPVEGDSERSLADVDVDAVRILTIHKAKGLEFDAVVVGDLARRNQAQRGPGASVRVVPTADGARIAVAVAGIGNVASLLRATRDALHEEAESKRLLYVAATRARERLILVVGAREKGRARWVEPLKALGFDDDHPPPDGTLSHRDVLHRRIAMPERRREPRPEAPADLERLAAAARRFDRAAAAARAPGPRFASPSAQDEAAELAFTGARDEEPGGGRDHARVVGVACHLALARSGPLRAPARAEIESAARTACAESACEPLDVAAEVAELLAAAPARALFAALAGVEPIAVELPVTCSGEGGPWRGTVDLLFRDRGRLVVADWKSDRGDDPAELARRHRPQLAIYARAIERALSTAPPAMELLLLRSGRRLAL